MRLVMNRIDSQLEEQRYLEEMPDKGPPKAGK